MSPEEVAGMTLFILEAAPPLSAELTDYEIAYREGVRKAALLAEMYVRSLS